MTTILESPVVVGTDTPKHAGSCLELDRSNVQVTFTAAAWSSADYMHAGGMFFIRSRSSVIGTFQETLDGDQLGEMEFFGCDAGNTLSMIAATIRVFQDGAAGCGRVPTRFEFGTGTGLEDVKTRLIINSKGSVAVGDGVNLLPNNAKAGFLNLPAMGGRPTGIPDALPGTAPICINASQNELCIYVGEQWRFIALP